MKKIIGGSNGCDDCSGNENGKTWRNVRGGGPINRQIRKNPNNSKLAIVLTVILSAIGVALIGYAIIIWQNSIRSEYSVVGKTFINLPASDNGYLGPEVFVFDKDGTSIQLREYENDGKLRNVLNLKYKISGDTVSMFVGKKLYFTYKIKWIDKEKYEAVIDSIAIETHVLSGSKYDTFKLE